MADARPGQDHILITGLGKTGTSGVYTSIKTALAKAGHETRAFFEPGSADVLFECFRQAPQLPVLAKLILPDLDRFGVPPAAFERRVMTVRDPRDTAISLLLFRPLINAVLTRLPDADLERFLDALRRKEQDPSSISVRDLFRLSADLHMGARPRVLLVDALEAQRRTIDAEGFQVVRYEDFVSGRLDDLSDYLGVEVQNISTLGSSVHGHISRSESTGSFRDWFTPADVGFFGRLWGPVLDRLGYPRDVELAVNPVIDPKTSSEYLRTNFYRRRDMLSHRQEDIRRAGAGAKDAAAVFADLVERSDNGQPRASVEAARLALGGGLGERRPDQALALARTAAQSGSVAGMQLVVELLGGTSEPAAVRERLGWRQELRARQSEVDLRLAAELEELRGSASYRLGNALVRAARAPRRNAVPAGREVMRLWRERKA